MVNIIVMGHGGYAEGIRGNLEMLSGIPEGMYFLDLDGDGGLGKLQQELDELVENLKNQSILYACDLLGASPFRLAALKCVEFPNTQILVTGLNTMAYVELSIPEENLSLLELAERAVSTTKESVSRFIIPVIVE